MSNDGRSPGVWWSKAASPADLVVRSPEARPRVRRIWGVRLGGGGRRGRESGGFEGAVGGGAEGEAAGPRGRGRALAVGAGEGVTGGGGVRTCHKRVILGGWARGRGRARSGEARGALSNLTYLTRTGEKASCRRSCSPSKVVRTTLSSLPDVCFRTPHRFPHPSSECLVSRGSPGFSGFDC